MTREYNYKDMPKSQIPSPLSGSEFGFIYNNLKDKKTYSYIDKNKKVNLIANCGNRDAMSLLKAKKSIYIDKHSLGVVIKVQFTEYNFSFDFVYDVYNERDLNILNEIINSDSGIMINFLAKQGANFFKIFHIDFNLEDGLKERLSYIKNITYDLQYPRIEESVIPKEEVTCLYFEYNINIITDIIETCDKLSKWKSADYFKIYVDYDESINIYILGECKNLSLIKSELNSKYTMINENKKLLKGVPLLKYDKGYISFYKYEEKPDIS